MLTIIKIALAKLFHKPYNSLLSVLLFAIGVALISLIIKTEHYINNQYKNNLAGIDLVVGAKGSPLQLILSSVLHIDAPTGNISLEEANKIQKNPLVKQSIPIALGDSHKGFRIVGTELPYLELYACEYAEGKSYTKPLEAVIGAQVAAKTGLKLGDTFTGVHGFMDQGHSHDDFTYTVVGILKKSGNVTDNLILTPIESVWMVHGETHNHNKKDHNHDADCEHHEHEHDHSHHTHAKVDNHNDVALEEIKEKISNAEELSEEEAQLFNESRNQLHVKESKPSEAITALLVFYKSPQAAITLPRAINENTSMQAASPAIEMNRLLSFLGMGLDTLRILAWIIIFISALNIFIYLLNLFNQSTYEIALLRLGGASRFKVLTLLHTQGIILAVLGWIVGMIASYSIMTFLPQSNLGNNFSTAVFYQELLLLVFCLGIGIFAALIPAIKAYKSNIHFTLNR